MATHQAVTGSAKVILSLDESQFCAIFVQSRKDVQSRNFEAMSRFYENVHIKLYNLAKIVENLCFIIIIISDWWKLKVTAHRTESSKRRKNCNSQWLTHHFSPL